MNNTIGPINPIKLLSPINQTDGINKVGNNSQNEQFSTFMKEAMNKLETSQVEGEAAAALLATGKTDDFHTPVIAMEKASLSLGLAVTVRNKVLDAYHEIMRMQI